MDKAMMKALEMDGEKLLQMTGEDHGPYFPRCDCEPWPGKCPYCGEEGFPRVVDTGDELHQILGEALAHSNGHGETP